MGRHGATVVRHLRDLRDCSNEFLFFAIYATPVMHWIGRSQTYQRTKKDPAELRYLPSVQAILLNVERGGFAEAVIRMLILLAESRGSVRRDRLERSAKVLSHDEPFASLGVDRRVALIHEQTVIAEYEREAAIKGLAAMLPAADERAKALGVVEYIAGSIEEMEPGTIKMLQRFSQVLDLPQIETNLIATDPLLQFTVPDPAAAAAKALTPG